MSHRSAAKLVVLSGSRRRSDRSPAAHSGAGRRIVDAAGPDGGDAADLDHTASAAARPLDADSAAYIAAQDVPVASTTRAARASRLSSTHRMPPESTADRGVWIPPTEFDEYRLVRLIGRGAMGQVYLAHDRVLDRPVAVKFITALAADARERFLVEARAAARIQHPNVIAIYRVGELDGHPYLITEYVRGQNLAELRLPLPGATVLDLGVGLARGLAAAHRQGVLHRDIKLANAIVSERGDVKLLDFSLAKLVADGPALDTLRREASLRPTPAELPVSGLDATGASAVGMKQATPTPRPPDPDDALDATQIVRHPSVSPSVAFLRSFAAGHRSPGADLTEVGTLIGTPHYMAPELWRAEPASRRSDVYALGVLLYILACDHPPTEARDALQLARRIQQREPRRLIERAPELDPRLAAIIDRCVRRRPADRFASAEELRAALEALSPVGHAGLVPGGNPYRGLLAFEAEHRELFFGRTAEIQAVVDRLRGQPFVLVAGDSGVGKSSLCRAGVLPRVSEGELEPARTWVTNCVTPGRRPVHALVAALASGLDLAEDSLMARIRGEPDALERALRRQHGSVRGRVIFIDQLEELVTLASPEDAALAARLIGQLATGVAGVRVLATARADFLTRLAQLPGLGAELTRALYFLTPLGPEGIREAVLGPAQRKGVGFESEAIVEQLVQAGVDGSLPLLQFALAEIWEAKGPSDMITAAALDRLGGVDGALARHADGVLARLAPGPRRAAHTLLLRLVTLEQTRASLTRDELIGDDEAARAALEALLAGRLIVVREQPDGFIHEIAHEALIQRWTTLQVWLEEEAESRVVRHRLASAAADWDRLGHPPDALWGERQLVELRRLDAATLRPREAAFAAASEARARSRRRLRRVAMLAAPLVLALGFVGVRMSQRAAVLRAVDGHLASAAAIVAEARSRDAEAARRRDVAFTRFDAGDLAGGEAAWQLALAEAPLAPALYTRAARELETALSLAPDRADVRGTLAEVLYTRAALAEQVGDLAQAEDLIARVQLYDGDGAHVARWRAPAQLELSSDPPGAAVTLATYEAGPDGRQELGPPRDLGVTPLTPALPAGSHLLILRAPGRAEVRYPIQARRGEQLHLRIALPPDDAVPPGFVHVPAGRFLYGSAGDEDLRKGFFTAVPLHEVRTDAFLVARHETTHAEWLAFLDALPEDQRAARLHAGEGAAFRQAPTLTRGPDGVWSIEVVVGDTKVVARAGEPLRHPARARDAEQDWLQLPVTGIRWDDAEAYLRWLDATGKVPGARFCSELEWERAARGADGRRFPTGADIGPHEANFDETHARDFAAMGPDVVGSHPASASPFGLHDTMGNVWEWVTPAAGGDHVARGGAFFFAKLAGSATNRNVVDATFRDGTLGLRVCATPRFRT